MSELSFVVLHHQVGSRFDRSDQSHFDWMFQVDGSLRTWATPPVDQFETTVDLPGERLPDHRMKYLDYEGELSNDRGTVRRVLAGKLQVIESSAARFVGQLSWRYGPHDQTGFVVCQRINVDSGSRAEETREGWLFSFSPGRYETKR